MACLLFLKCSCSSLVSSEATNLVVQLGIFDSRALVHEKDALKLAKKIWPWNTVVHIDKQRIYCTRFTDPVTFQSLSLDAISTLGRERRREPKVPCIVFGPHLFHLRETPFSLQREHNEKGNFCSFRDLDSKKPFVIAALTVCNQAKFSSFLDCSNNHIFMKTNLTGMLCFVFKASPQSTLQTTVDQIRGWGNAEVRDWLSSRNCLDKYEILFYFLPCFIVGCIHSAQNCLGYVPLQEIMKNAPRK